MWVCPIRCDLGDMDPVISCGNLCQPGEPWRRGVLGSDPASHSYHRHCVLGPKGASNRQFTNAFLLCHWKETILKDMDSEIESLECIECKTEVLKFKENFPQ